MIYLFIWIIGTLFAVGVCVGDKHDNGKEYSFRELFLIGLVMWPVMVGENWRNKK